MNITSPSFDQSEIELLGQCLSSGWVTQGPFTQKFEALLAARHQTRHALATTSCTAALHLATLALGLGPGDEVLVPAFTWITSANSAEYVGARAVFVDVDINTFNIDPEKLRQAITAKTRAIVAVHLFGLAAPMQAILDIAKEHGLAVIEDAACAIGTTYKGTPVGALGDIGCFSFHPRKVITTGEGGMVTTNREDLAAAVASFRNHGSTGQAVSDTEDVGPWTMATFNRLGYNLRLSDIQASVGVAQMAKLDGLLAERRRLADHYSALLDGNPALALPLDPQGGHTYQSYVVRVLEGGRARRNALMAELAAKDIQTRPGTHAVHRLGYYQRRYGLAAGDFPVACICEDTTITLPIFPGMTGADQERVVATLQGALGSGK